MESGGSGSTDCVLSQNPISEESFESVADRVHDFLMVSNWRVSRMKRPISSTFSAMESDLCACRQAGIPRGGVGVDFMTNLQRSIAHDAKKRDSFFQIESRFWSEFLGDSPPWVKWAGPAVQPYRVLGDSRRWAFLLRFLRADRPSRLQVGAPSAAAFGFDLRSTIYHPPSTIYHPLSPPRIAYAASGWRRRRRRGGRHR